MVKLRISGGGITKDNQRLLKKDNWGWQPIEMQTYKPKQQVVWKEKATINPWD